MVGGNAYQHSTKTKKIFDLPSTKDLILPKMYHITVFAVEL